MLVLNPPLGVLSDEEEDSNLSTDSRIILTFILIHIIVHRIYLDIA